MSWPRRVGRGIGGCAGEADRPCRRMCLSRCIPAMNAEREKEAREHRSQGQELAEGIRAAADREVTVLKANAYRDSELIRGDGDADRNLHLRRGLQPGSGVLLIHPQPAGPTRMRFRGSGDVLLLHPDSEFFRYLKDSQGGK